MPEGFFNDQARTNVRTVSGPGWSSMLIGARTDKHLVSSNDFTGNDYATYPDFLTRLEQVDSGFNTFAVVDWAPLGTTASGGPLFGDAIDEVLFFNAGEEGYGRADSLSVDAAVDRLETGNIDAAFVYIGDTDEVAHATSTYAPEYRTAIEVADVLVGRLVAAIQARPTYADEDWLILMCTDHGRTDEGGHGGDSDKERTIFFLAPRSFGCSRTDRDHTQHCRHRRDRIDTPWSGDRSSVESGWKVSRLGRGRGGRER